MVKGSASERSEGLPTAVLGRGLRVVGRVRGDRDLRVEADIEGDVSVGGTLHLDEASRIVGSVEADVLIVAGRVEGDVSARKSVTITGTGNVRGTVSAPEVSLEEGGGLDGRIDAEFDLPPGLA
jgi:cytoskeletal protein CcmA (bactofilin family)